MADSGFHVSRVAHHDNTSEYFVSGTKTSYREVTDLLRNYGIDLDHNRFLILQGEVRVVLYCLLFPIFILFYRLNLLLS